MKIAFIILAMIVGVGLIYLIIAILPFLMAVASIAFIYWLIGMVLTGGLGRRR